MKREKGKKYGDGRKRREEERRESREKREKMKV